MEPIEKISLTDSVVENLTKMITSGQLSEGDKLPTEKELCNQLNVGRSTVREAYKVLKAMGLVQMIHGKGAYVKKTEISTRPSVSNWFRENQIQLTDIMEVRMAIEPLAVKLAISRITDEQIDVIDEIARNFIKAVKQRDLVRSVTNDALFHNEIVRATGNNLLISINQANSQALTEYRMRSLADIEHASNAIEPHKKILKAIKERSAEDGEREMIRHLEISLSDIYDVINKDVISKGKIR